MGAAWYRARGELRRRWRAMLVLVLLVAISGGAVLTLVAGARRSSTAYDRFREATLASDLDVAFDGPPDDDIEAAADAVRALPQVVALSRTDFPFVVPADSGFYPYLDFLAAVDGDGTYVDDVDRPRVVAGRLPDPDRDDEVAIIEAYAHESGLALGDRVEFESFAPEQMEPLFTTGDAGPPAGPRFTFVVTGVFDAPTFLSDSVAAFTPRLFLTPAFRRAHAKDVATYPGGFTLRFRNGVADTEAVSGALREMFPDTQLELTPAAEQDRKIGSSIDVIVSALLLCALVAGLAGAMAVAQAMARHFGADGGVERWLAALGMTRSQRVASQLASVLIVALLGAAGAAAAAVVASGLMPVGVAGRAEPDPGLAVDGPVLALGFMAIVLAVLVLAAVGAAAVDRRAAVAAGGGRPSEAPGRAMQVVRRTRLGPPATTGVGMALDPRGGTASSVRSATLGLVFGTVGVLTVVVLIGSVDGLARTPARYGSPFDAMVSGFSGDVLAEGGDELLADPDVARAGLGYNGLARVGGVEVNTFAIESLKGDLYFTLLEGRRPTGGAEVVLGRTILEQAGASIGDEVEIDGMGGSLRATIVGTAVFPIVDERSAPGRGVLLGQRDFERVSSPEEINADVLIDWADGVDVGVANAALEEATGTEVFAPRLPSDVNNLREVEPLLRSLAAFLGILAALALVHALMSTVRMRRGDLAVLRTLGFVRRQLGSTLVWQALTIGLVGLVAGVPLGLAAGQLVWRSLAGSLGVVDHVVAPMLGIAGVVFTTLVVLYLAAVVPGRAARSVAAASILRSG